MEGHIRLKTAVERRTARMRLREKLLVSFKQLSLPSGKEKTFADMLDTNFTFVVIDFVLSRETHFWRFKGGVNVLPPLPPTLAA